jgi:hypothetical protein
MNLLDDTWVNRKSSPDTSENFQLKIKEMNKTKSKTPNINRVQQFKQTTTYINNPQMQNSQFKNLISTNDKSGKLLFKGGNLNQNLIGKVTTSDGDEEYSNINEDIMNTAEKINRLQSNCVKSNNLREMDGKYTSISNNFSNKNLINYSNYIYNNNTPNTPSFNPVNQSVLGYTSECNEEFNYAENFNRDLSKKTLYPKFIEANNTLTRLSTEESNESFESTKNNNKFGIMYDEKYSFLTPVQNRVYPKTPMIQQQYPQGKQINFNNYNMNNTNSNAYYSQQRDPNLINNNIYMGDYNQQRVNLQNLPENAFSFNTDSLMNMNSFNMKCNSDKKKIKKSREEVDQTLFVINTKNIIEGKDIRTTVMIRHIPNKYSTQCLLEEINVSFKGKYDFFYLPMDYEVNLYLFFRINVTLDMHLLILLIIYTFFTSTMSLKKENGIIINPIKNVILPMQNSKGNWSLNPI